MRRKSWTKEQLLESVRTSKSIRQVLLKLNLVPAGGNYEQILKYIKHYNIDYKHFLGMGWSKGVIKEFKPTRSLEEILSINSNFQSFKLKSRLYREGIKEKKCEECGWAKMSEDGRIPLELDHINGNKLDNRIENLRILCPNCHSLKPTHRGKNKKSARVT